MQNEHTLIVSTLFLPSKRGQAEKKNKDILIRLDNREKKFMFKFQQSANQIKSIAVHRT